MDSLFSTVRHKQAAPFYTALCPKKGEGIYRNKIRIKLAKDLRP